jgi:hypothetical protein
LVHGASIPRADELPASIRELAYRNAVPVRDDPDFRNDIERLIAEIHGLEGNKRAGFGALRTVLPALVVILGLIFGALALLSEEWRNDFFYKLGVYTATPTPTVEVVAIVPTETPTDQPTRTVASSETPLPPTATETPTLTNTPTNTTVPPSETPLATFTITSTSTTVSPTSTHTELPTQTETATAVSLSIVLTPVSTNAPCIAIVYDPNSSAVDVRVYFSHLSQQNYASIRVGSVVRIKAKWGSASSNTRYQISELEEESIIGWIPAINLRLPVECDL